MSVYLGDYAEDETVYFMWDTFDGSGASITRATDGTVSVYKDNGATQSTAGITGTEDFDSLTGIHEVTIDTSADAFYAVGADYAVVLSAATIDGQSVNAVLAHFSIENRFEEVTLAAKTHTGAVVPLVTTTTTATTATNLTNLPTIPANWLTAAGTAADFGTEIAAAIAAVQVESEGTVSLQEALSIILAFAAGVTSGQDTASPVFNAPNSSTSRITGTTDGNGNRTATAITPSS